MKRSEMNKIYLEAKAIFAEQCWVLPPNPRWDITDFGLGEFEQFGLTLINLAEEPEYCEKLMYAREGQTTPAHMHKKKKEDIIARHGNLALHLWADDSLGEDKAKTFTLRVNGTETTIHHGEQVVLQAGERITLVPGIYHEFFPINGPCIIGEVSTANDDLNDNFFVREDIGRYSEIDEDEPAAIKLLNE